MWANQIFVELWADTQQSLYVAFLQTGWKHWSKWNVLFYKQRFGHIRGKLHNNSVSYVFPDWWPWAKCLSKLNEIKLKKTTVIVTEVSSSNSVNAHGNWSVGERLVWLLDVRTLCSLKTESRNVKRRRSGSFYEGISNNGRLYIISSLAPFLSKSNCMITLYFLILTTKFSLLTSGSFWKSGNQNQICLLSWQFLLHSWHLRNGPCFYYHIADLSIRISKILVDYNTWIKKEFFSLYDY